MPYSKPLGRTREAIEIIRAAMRREKLEFDGKSFQLPLPAGEGTGLGKPLKMLTHPERDSVPIYIAALGQKSVEGTAEYADGWLPFLYSPEGASKVWGDALAAGTAKRSADLAPLEIAAGGMVAVGDDVKGLLDFARPLFALYIGGMGARGKNFYNDLACRTATSRRPRRSRTSTSTARRRRPRPPYPSSCWSSPTSSARSPTSRSASRPSASPA